MTTGNGPGPETGQTAQDAVARTEDCLGLFCPMPVLRLAGALREVEIGERVNLLADDPASRVDIPVWCRTKDQELLRVAARSGGGWVFQVRRAR